MLLARARWMTEWCHDGAAAASFQQLVEMTSSAPEQRAPALRLAFVAATEHHRRQLWELLPSLFSQAVAPLCKSCDPPTDYHQHLLRRRDLSQACAGLVAAARGCWWRTSRPETV